ncbi:polysaccharide deacetylase family protein [Pullulanibacillus sp. KACC 23026]|uniref:polysaccharide deacetylase family protein n=1 Tax=Pullulanibacillus sp. KACC 23026 TaxID=3028315 RepID=UPI0023B18765|nr:polysaccharide deacetylase family protein [Pullulanibacillus sp. KACC 23026]WEG11574.1 polysaccharide deacetylase family protein [Pullulanibacillus sp. KACC 23026]
MKRMILSGLVFACLVWMTFGSISSYRGLFLSQFIPQLNALDQTAAGVYHPLLNKIKTYAGTHNVKPIDAKLDPVWKAVPGYNGREVNIMASYHNMEDTKTFDPSKVVYQEVPPKVHLKDLAPHPIYHGNPNKPMVALLINVSTGSNEYLPQILKTLDQFGVSATFFLDGQWVKDNPRLAMLICEEGHAIGNFGYNQENMKTLSKAKQTAQIKKTNDVLEAVLDIKPHYFFPPQGSFNEQTLEATNKLGMRTVLWSVDTLDWKNPDPNDMLEIVNTEVESGSMVVMRASKGTAESIGSMIESIEQKGYTLGTVPELLSEERIGD